jgi:hypothetical protein
MVDTNLLTSVHVSAPIDHGLRLWRMHKMLYRISVIIEIFEKMALGGCVCVVAES